MTTLQVPTGDQLLASAVRFLVEGQENDLANLLLSCSLHYEGGKTAHGGWRVSITLRAPRVVYEMFAPIDEYHNAIEYADAALYEKAQDALRIYEPIREAITAVMPATVTDISISFRAQLVDIDENWREELLQIAQGKDVHNQAIEAERVVIWKNLRFRSQAEARIAEALERVKVEWHLKPLISR